MTENNSDFAPEPNVGNAIEVSQEIKETNPPADDSKCENYVDCNDSPKELDLTENNEDQPTENISTILECEWSKMSSFFYQVYRNILNNEKPPDDYECHMNVKKLVANDPHQLFARLEMDLQEFIIEIKLEQMELLNCVRIDQGPHLFIFCLIENYNRLMLAADTFSPLLTQLESEHLAKFNITWRGLNQHLFHKLFFTESKIQKILPFCISKLGKKNSTKTDFKKQLIRNFLTFDDEMTKIGGKWREAESAIIKYHQENSMLDAKERMMKTNWERIQTQTKAFHEELKFAGFCDYFNEHLKKIKSDMENGQDQAVCECCNLNATQCLFNSVPLSLESLIIKSPSDCSSQCESLDKDAEILSHLNADGKKMYSHLYKFKDQQQLQQQQKHQQQLAANEEKSPLTSPTNKATNDITEMVFNVEQNVPKSPTGFNVDNNVPTSATDTSVKQTALRPTSDINVEQNVPTSPPAFNAEQNVMKTAPQHKPKSAPVEVHQTLLRTQKHRKKLMQLVQSVQQKDHKVQEQLQEHQLLLQQERKIDELQAYLLQKHPRLVKEMQKKVNVEMQHRMVQKHKQMEDKFHPQVQHHQEKPAPAIAAKLNGIQKTPGATSQSGNPSCNHAKPTVTSPKSNNHKCVNAPSLGNTQAASSSVATAQAGSSAKTNVANPTSAKVTHKNSTTQTKAGSAPGQNRVGPNPLPDVVKSASYICMKHSEANKADGKVDPYDFSDFCFSSGDSSDEDYCSERSNSPQRHCDCCYCEVFGTAPVNRNYQETRERLRLILTKKKAKSNSAAASNDKQVSGQNSSPAQINAAVSQPASQGAKAKKEDATAASADKKTKPLAPEYKGDKSIEEILDFIEGNKSRNVKRTAKKMRRKQRQLEEEERRRKEEEEAERLRQEEIRRKEEEEKRRIEEERRRQELLKEQNRKKNKKKNSRQNQQLNALLASQQSSKKNNKKNASQIAANDKSKSAQNQPSKNANQKQTQQQQSKQSNQQQTKKGKQEPAPVKQQQGKQKVQQEKPKVQQPAKNANTQKKTPNQQKTGKNDSSEQPQMVTIKRVMQPNSNEPTVTITLRGPTPKEDKVLYTLLNGQMCPLKEEKGKKQTSAESNNNVNNKKNPNKPSVTLTNTYANNNNTNNYNNFSISNPNAANMLPKQSIPFNKSCSIVGSGINSITERMERLKLGPLPVPTEPVQKMISAPTATQAELTTPTAIQINQAVNQLSSRPTFPNSFDLENIKLPPGITITKVDPASVNRKPIQQMKQQPPPPPPPQAHIRQTMMSPMAGSSNVIVVDTGEKNNYYQSGDQTVNGMKKRRRRRKKNNGDASQPNMSMPSSFGAANGLPPRMGAVNAGMFGNPFMSNDFHRNVPQQPAAIIQMNGSMVTIRNPALQQALAGQQMDYHDGMADIRSSNLDENMFSSVPEEIENGDVDEYERELEAFKRFCSQSVPAESKAKVNLNLEDIVLKKKGPVIGCS